MEIVCSTEVVRERWACFLPFSLASFLSSYLYIFIYLFRSFFFPSPFLSFLSLRMVLINQQLWQRSRKHNTVPRSFNHLMFTLSKSCQSSLMQYKKTNLDLVCTPYYDIIARGAVDQKSTWFDATVSIPSAFVLCRSCSSSHKRNRVMKSYPSMSRRAIYTTDNTRPINPPKSSPYDCS